MVKTIAQRVASRYRWDSGNAEDEAKELLVEMIDDIPSGLNRVLDHEHIETSSERKVDEVAYAIVEWEGTNADNEAVVSVTIKAHVGVSADEDGLYGFTGASYEMSGEDFFFDWHGNTHSFDHRFTQDAQKVYEKLKDKAPEVAKLFK